MVDLKCTEIIELKLTYPDSDEVYTTLDCSSRQFENKERLFYLGQGSQLIQFFERDLDKVINFLNEVKKLPMTEVRKGWLK